MKECKKVLISIVTWKAREHIEKCLQTLMDQDYDKECYDVLLSDNNSIDGTKEFVRKNFSEVLILENKENIGFTGGHNKSFEYALANDYDYVLVTGYDTFYEKDWLSQQVKTAETDPEIGIVQSLMLLAKEPEKVNSCGNKLHYLVVGFTDHYQLPRSECECKTGKELASCSGTNMLIKKEVLKTLGGFDNALFAFHEDTDLAWQTRLAGYKVVLCKESILYHQYEFFRSAKTYSWIEKNRLILFLTNYEVRTLLLLLPIYCVLEFGMMLYALKNGYWKERIEIWGCLFQSDFWKIIRGRRKHISKIRKKSDQDLIGLMTDKIEFQDVKNPLLDNIGNPVMQAYWRAVKKII